jgi:hypothetical protein
MASLNSDPIGIERLISPVGSEIKNPDWWLVINVFGYPIIVFH